MEAPMNSINLRPPLPPPLTHDNIRFVIHDSSASNKPIDAEIVAVIGAALQSVLPSGDLAVASDGSIIQAFNSQEEIQNSSRNASLWYQAGLIAGIDRSPT
jgi:hypothetical protein